MLTARSSVREVEMLPGVVRRTLSSGVNTTLCELEIRRGAVVPLHTHLHEQTGYLVRGRLRFQLGEEELVLEAGDSWLVPGMVPHAVEALDDCVAIDVFSPVRLEYL